MKNINKKIPTISELKEKIEKDNILYNDEYILNEHLTKCALKLLTDHPDFSNYLLSNNFNDFELPTVVFSEIQYYILEKIERNQIEELTKMFNYLEKLLSE
jgi:hypothetical protein